MLASLLNLSRVTPGLVRVSPGCAVRVQEAVSKLFYSSVTEQAPESRQERITDTTTDPFLAHLQQKTEKELFEILRKQQQQQPSTQDDDEETSDPVTATGEYGGPKGAYAGAEPTRYGDWEKGGRCTDF